MPNPVETGLGVQSVLRGSVSIDHPMSFAETGSGLLLLANGIDPMLRWDGFAGLADTAGVAAPATAMELGGTGPGTITGKLVAFVRFVDAYGNVSDMSPASNLMDAGMDGLIDTVDYDRSTGVATVTSPGHGLATGDAIVIAEVQGIPQVNGQWAITVVDADTFTVNNLVVTSGFYTTGGYWTLGIKTVIYGAVPVPTEAKVKRRQILRNLSGNLDVLYVDIDTDDLTSTAFSSTADDATLATGEPVPLTYGDSELPYANRHGLPPSHKAVIASHKGRIFAAGDSTYSVGHAEAKFNSEVVQGVGTRWKSNFAGRMIWLSGATSPYEIASIDEATQQATLTAPYLDKPVPFQLYVIRPETGGRRLIQYSEAGFPESWPAYNAVGVPECNDEIVSLISLGQYLYIVERRHVHRFTFELHPGDGAVFLLSKRGVINHRCHAIAENTIYFLDEIGIHKFDGVDSTPISQPVQNLFNQDGTSFIEIDWTADQTLWHAAADPVRDTIRWFVAVTGFEPLTHAICYNYRTERWWIEQYPTPITASANATIGCTRSLAGTTARRVLCLSNGNYDGVQAGGTLRGTVETADATSLTDSSASFDAVEGAPVSIVEGTGAGQQRIIASATATSLTILEPWDTTPDATSVYQVGGIQWEWHSGWFKHFDDEDSNTRDIFVVFSPTSGPGSMTLNVFYDHSGNAATWARSIEQDGVTTEDGSADIVINLENTQGFARQRHSGHADPYSYAQRFVSVSLAGVQAGDPVRVSQVILDGLEAI